jgi:Protein of unknown function (DUF3300)
MKRNASRFGAGASRWTAIALSFLLIALVVPGLYAQMPPPGEYAPLDATQLNQLVAPIALYPDSLVAQILTAATYPQQVSEASNWMHQNGGLPPGQLANAVNGMPWDPSVKALAEFPSVLDNMARNYDWTSALGNAYYNQPGDVMNAVQAMRVLAQQAGTLRTTPQERVYDSGGLVVIEPVNPAFVYVPYYNPWVVYGEPLLPWGGYYLMPPPRGLFMAGRVGIGFGVGISLGIFSHYGWGYHAWRPNWHGGVVVYNRTTYISRSATVANRGRFGGYNRGVYERGGRGVPRGFRPPVTARSAQFHPAPAGTYHSPAARPGTYNRPGARQAPAPAYHPGAEGSHTPSGRPSGAYSRPSAPYTPSHARPQGSYGAGRPPAAPQARPAPSRPSAPQAHPQSTPGRGRPQGSEGGQPKHPQKSDHPEKHKEGVK